MRGAASPIYDYLVAPLNFLLITNKEYLCMQQDYYHKQWQSNYQT